MIKNYPIAIGFKIAWRNIIRQKVYSTINILGLSLGICVSLVLYLVVRYEFGFDTFHPDKERVYRVMGDITESTGDKLHFNRVPALLPQTARNEMSGLDVIAAAIPFNAKISVPGGNNKKRGFFESKISGTNYITTAITEPQYFKIFKYKWLAGNSATALQAPLQVVITERKARQYFGTTPLGEIIGKQLIYHDSLVVSVSGIIKDWDEKSDISFTDFISYSTLNNAFLKKSIVTDSWNPSDMNTWAFVKLAKGKTAWEVNSQLEKLVANHTGSAIKLTPWLEPISAVHFNANVIENPIRTAHLPTLYALTGIALFILILAIINFINLSTAQALKRAKEVGVRKILGSSRLSLVFQFLIETFIITSIAFLLAASFINPVLRGFHSFIPNGITFNVFARDTIIFIGLSVLIIPLLAGIYPAIELSSNSPALQVKQISKTGQKSLIRKGLIVFQFAVSLVFIIASMVIGNQLRYTREKDLGFNSDAILVLENPRGEGSSKLEVLKDKIKQIPNVINVAKQWQSPMHDNPREMKLKTKNTDVKDFWVKQIAGNEDFIPLYEIKLLAGRNLVITDTVNEFVINESLASLIGSKTPGQAIGKVLFWNDKPYPVVGVVADFHTKSLHETITPSCIINRPERENALAVKLSSNGKQTSGVTSSLSRIENIWKDLYPGKTFSFEFYDESLAKLYEKDQKAAKLMNTAMGVTIFISCIGLFGLGMFTSERRTKEIGIRKILGASIGNITVMLSRDFVILVSMALLIASPVAWYFMNKWLQEFAYRIYIEWWVFIFAGLGAITIALLTVSFHTIKAAIANPVKSLRTE